MQHLATFALIVFFGWIFRTAGPVWAILATSAAGAGGYFLWRRISAVRRLRRYGRQIENIYVTSRAPGDRTVMSRAETEREWLKKAGNRLDVFVIPILFQDGEHCNETWEEYQERIKLEIAEDRIRRHTYLKQTNPEFYLKYVHSQKGVQLDQ